MGTLVIYHGSCFDGHCSAWVARKCFPNAEFHAAEHGSKPPDVKDKNVFIFDFSYPRETLETINKQAKSLQLFDHHISSRKQLQGLPYCTFDLNKSGCRLAWDYFSKINGWGYPHWLVLYAEDRDLWRWQLPMSRQVNAAIAAEPMTFDAWDNLSKKDLKTLSDEGSVILKYESQQAESVIRAAREVSLDGFRVLAANTYLLNSEIATKLAAGRPFGMVWHQKGNGRFYYSLRSDQNGIDVSEFASRFGGGGHPKSAAFSSDKLLI